MKRQIRRGVFETNSSSTHSLTLLLETDYDRWNEEDVFLFRGSGYCYPEGNKPQNNHLYTKEEAIAFEKSSKFPPSKDFDWEDDEAIMELLHDNSWHDAEYFWDYYAEEYETFEDTMVTPSGEKIIAFGYYGYN